MASLKDKVPAIVAWSVSALVAGMMALTLGLMIPPTSASATQVGPSFSCMPAPQDALARSSCNDPTLAKSDLRLIQTYYALRTLVGPQKQAPLKSEFLTFIVSTRRTCGLPVVEPGRDQTNAVLPRFAAECVVASYERQRALWAARLSRPAAEEATRAPETNVALQAKLQTLGLLPATPPANGVFGTGTRTGITAWQRSTGRPETQFFGDGDAALLLGTASSLPIDFFAAYRIKPLGEAAFSDKPVTVQAKGMSAALSAESSGDAAICGAPSGGILWLDSRDSHTLPPCRVIILRVIIDGKEVFLDVDSLVVDGLSVGLMNPTVSLIQADKSTSHPQVVLTRYKPTP